MRPVRKRELFPKFIRNKHITVKTTDDDADTKFKFSEAVIVSQKCLFCNDSRPYFEITSSNALGSGLGAE